MSITCYALMFLLVTTKLRYVLIIADSDFIEEFACFSMFFATTNHFSCHWLIEVWLVYIFFNAVACLYSCLHYAVTKTSSFIPHFLETSVPNKLSLAPCHKSQFLLSPVLARIA